MENLFGTEMGEAKETPAVRIRRTKKEVEQQRYDDAIRLIMSKLGQGADEQADSTPEETAFDAADGLKLLSKLHNIQTQCLGIVKDATAKDLQKKTTYGWVTEKKVLGIIRPLMDAAGLLLIPEVRSLETSIIDVPSEELMQNGQPRWTKQCLCVLGVNFKWVDTETGASQIVPFVSVGCNGLEQGVSSALTYAERNFLMKFFHIASDDDELDAIRREASGPGSLREMLNNNPPVAAEVLAQDNNEAKPANDAPEDVKEETEKKPVRRSRKSKAAEEKAPEATENAPETAAAEQEQKPAETEQPASEAVKASADAQQEAAAGEEAAKPAEVEAETAPEQEAAKSAEEKQEEDDAPELKLIGDEPQPEQGNETQAKPVVEEPAKEEPAQEPVKEDKPAEPEKVFDNNGNELKAEAVKDAGPERIDLTPNTALWTKVSIRLFTESAGKTKEEVRAIIDKDYLITDKDFDDLYDLVTA